MNGRLGNGKCALDKMDHLGHGRNFVKSPGLDISSDKSRFDVLPGTKNLCRLGQRQKLSLNSCPAQRNWKWIDIAVG